MSEIEKLWRLLKRFLEDELDRRKDSGFADDNEYIADAQAAIDALTQLWGGHDRLREALRELLEVADAHDAPAWNRDEGKP